MKPLSCILYALLGLLLVPAAAVWAAPSAMQCALAQHWREIAYLDPPMDRYAPFKNCVAWTAYQFDLPEELLYAVLYVERGDISGKCSVNANGTMDCGPAQINNVRIGELKRFSLSMQDMRSKPCHNIWAMGYLLRREIEGAGGRLWEGVGNYHYHISVNPVIHQRYVRRIQRSWQRLNHLIQEACPAIPAS